MLVKNKGWKHKSFIENWSKYFQIWGQANFWSQAKNLYGANFGAKIEVRPTLRPGQTNETRPGFIAWLFLITVGGHCWLKKKLVRKDTFKSLSKLFSWVVFFSAIPRPLSTYGEMVYFLLICIAAIFESVWWIPTQQNIHRKIYYFQIIQPLAIPK